MIFSELYSAYYNTVARIIEKALDSGVTEQELRQCVEREAFSESILTILPALKSGRWPLLNRDLTSVLRHKPTMPLTNLEKRWLKAISQDPRIKLFGVEFPDLDEVEPLFTGEDYKVYDRYQDGDPYEDERYIKNFRLMLEAVRSNRPVKIRMINRMGREAWVRFYPRGFEYSLKDDKIRVIASGCKFRQFNMGRVLDCDFYSGSGPWLYQPAEEERKDLTLLIINKRNALERAMLHFAHFEKRVERMEDDRYVLHLKYYGNDEAELVIRVLSFGPFVKVLAPKSFEDLIKNRLILQKSCEL